MLFHSRNNSRGFKRGGHKDVSVLRMCLKQNTVIGPAQYAVFEYNLFKIVVVPVKLINDFLMRNLASMRHWIHLNFSFVI